MKPKLTELVKRPERFLVLTFFIAVLVVLLYTFFSPNYYQSTAPIQFDIKKGEPFTIIVDRLYQKGMIASKTNFRIAAFIYGAEKRVRAARFFIPNGLSYISLLDLFISGDCNFAREINISGGNSIHWVASLLQWKVFIDSANFVESATDTNLINDLGLNQKSLEGYLFADGIEIYEHSSPDEAVRILYNSFKNFYTDSLKQREAEIGYTTHEILTLASIVEGETNIVEEMPRIAAVYHNRLKRRMKLQADPTIQYLIPGKWRRVLFKDLEIDSPYNTYKYRGLPPGPINNPGKHAILAALYPEENNFLYFVADGKGGHKFSKTFNEHLKKVRLYRRWVRSQKN
ncbi:MAG: endolytic transglycosylase MltG [Ignavibacterium sp.]|nr:MAG: endolytic transglycosylase MltG [Ignavibacterium sp.]